MGVEYRNKLTSSVNDDFSQMLNEAHHYFRQQHKVSILGEGIKDVLTDTSLFEEYMDKLTEGMDATEEEHVRSLMENARMQIFQESSIAGVQPVASLTFPILRKLWARTGIVKVMPTEVVKSNTFSVPFNKPYIIDDNGDKHYLPEALDDLDTELGEKKPLSKDPITIPATDVDLLALVGCSKATGDTIDMNFAIDSVKATTSEGEQVIPIPRNKGKIDFYSKIYIEVNYTTTNGDVEEVDKLFGIVDHHNGLVNLISMTGNSTEFTVKGYVATDAHNHATNVSFEVGHRDFIIGTGTHFEASLPLEFLQDSMASYQIDGTTEVVDLMSNMVAQKLDQEIFKFLRDMQTNNPKYQAEFDMRPSYSFAGSPKDWRDELKPVFDYLAHEMKQKSHLYQCYFAVIGNPIDMQVIPNVDWTFNHTVDQQGGVPVDYNLGAMSGSNNYTLVASDIVPKGDMYMLAIPTINNYHTARYYPYTFNVVNNYLNTQRTNVPSIMMTKRHTIEEFMPLIAKITLLNNTVNMLKELPRTVPMN